MQFDGESGVRWAYWVVGPISYEVSATATGSEGLSDLEAPIKPIVAEVIEDALSASNAGVRSPDQSKTN